MAQPCFAQAFSQVVVQEDLYPLPGPLSIYPKDYPTTCRLIWLVVILVVAYRAKTSDLPSACCPCTLYILLTASGLFGCNNGCGCFVIITIPIFIYFLGIAQVLISPTSVCCSNMGTGGVCRKFLSIATRCFKASQPCSALAIPMHSSTSNIQDLQEDKVILL